MSEHAETDFEDIVISDKRRVSCAGGDGALGHPRVYMEMGGDDQVICGYCDKRFILAGSALAQQVEADPDGT